MLSSVCGELGGVMLKRIWEVFVCPERMCRAATSKEWKHRQLDNTNSPRTDRYPFNDVFFSRTTWVSGHHKKVKPFWILMKQETMGWQWHPLDYMQIICTTLQTNNHTTRPDSSIRYRRYINHLLTYLEPHHSVFCRPDTLPDAQPTVSKHGRPTDLEQVNRDNYAGNQLIQIHLGK